MRSFKNKKLFTLKIVTIATLGCLSLVPLSNFAKQVMSDNLNDVVKEEAIQVSAQQAIIQAPIERAKIQMAILLDTSSSMDGLIDQTRNQIWSVVNEFSTAKKGGVTPILEVALFEYGNDSNSGEVGYIRKLNSFTRELDLVSEGLFSLSTNGGSEFCGYAIKTATTSLQWSQSSDDVKVIFIAGNEGFSQGPVRHIEAIKMAEKKGIAVNTIYAGDHHTGIREGWQNGAQLAGGEYMSIDADRQIVHIDAPQDKQIAKLNSQLNETYIPYGKLGKDRAKRQLEQDRLNGSISSGLLAKRAKSKSSSFYNNSSWDLVDALRDGKVKESELATLDEGQLPQKMKAMSSNERKEHIESQGKLRKELKQEISRLGESRKQYVAQKKKEQAKDAPSVSDALSNAVKKQATQKGFQLEGKS